jgi:RNA polymerase sigma-70 factor, ECF subfamily
MDHRPFSGSSEAELVERAQNRDPDAFAELMSRNSSPSFRLALSVLKDRQEAEDEVQTSFMKAWVSLPKFKSEARFSTWFRTIVLNQSLMRLRQIRRANLRSLDEEDEEGRTREVASTDPLPEARLSGSELTQHLDIEVRKLPRLLREALVLRDMEELTTDEVASRLGISEPAVKSRLSRARAMLRHRMERHTESPAGRT